MQNILITGINSGLGEALVAAKRLIHLFLNCSSMKVGAF